MSFGFQRLTNSQSSHRRLGAFHLFSVAGLVMGIGSQGAMAQSATGSASTQGVSVKNNGTQTTNQNLQGKLLKAKLGQEVATEYLVEHPSWRESKAVRVVDARRPYMNIEKTLFSQVLVGVENETVLKSAIAAVGIQLGTNRPGAHNYRPYLDVSGVYVVEGISVEDAINLANELTKLDGVLWAEVNHQNKMKSAGGSTLFSDLVNDPLADEQWHIFNPAAFPFNNDHNLLPVYDRGITGAGVVVGVLEAFQNSFFHVDDMGATNIHPDLANKLDFSLSRPTAPYDEFYSHGVSVAGLIAAEPNNGRDAAGVAYGATLASLRNGSDLDIGESFGHEIQNIDIVNNSWVYDNLIYPPSNTGKYLAIQPDDFEITIPNEEHTDVSRFVALGLDKGIRLGRGRKGRIFVFSAGNGSHFQGFDRLALGNTISLPGRGVPDGMLVAGLPPVWDTPSYGYLDITGLSGADADLDGIPDVFLLNGKTTGMAPAGDPAALGWRWSGQMGERVEYNQIASLSRTIAIASVGMSNNRSGYSTTGTSVFAGAYSQDWLIGQEFTPDNNGPISPPGSWGASVVGQGLTTIEQIDGIDSDPLDCNAIFGAAFGSSVLDEDGQACMFNGTSAAAPVAAGVIALMLEQNPNLTIRDVQHILQRTSTVVNYDSTQTYWPTVFFTELGRPNDDDTQPPTPTFWTTNSVGVRHSDEYGFGIIDADAAVTMAATWPGAGQLHLFDSSLVTEGDEGFFDDGTIGDATFELTAIISENLEINRLNPGTRLTIDLNCVRENYSVEGVELTVTIEGDGAGDLLIALESPRGTISPLALPRGDSNEFNGNAYTNYTFTTYKHWGELTGGVWSLILQDFRPDEDSPEGELATNPWPDMPDASDNGVEQVTYLGTFGLPGEPMHTEKKLLSYQLKIFSTQNDLPINEACPILITSCPADLDGNGIVEVIDLQIYISWWTDANPLADLNGDGNIDYNDLFGFRAIWSPGFCNSLNDPFVGGRPRPGGTRGDNDPIIHPI